MVRAAVVLSSAFFLTGHTAPAGRPHRDCFSDRPITYFVSDEVDSSTTSIERGGQVVVQMPSEYFGVVNALLRVARSHPEKTDTTHRSLGDMGSLIAIFRESRTRTTYFVDGATRRLMLTTWQFTKDRAQLCIPQNLINVTVSGGQGTAAIVASTDSSERMAKVRWISTNEKIQYELYLSPLSKESSEIGKLTNAQMVDLATEITKGIALVDPALEPD